MLQLRRRDWSQWQGRDINAVECGVMLSESISAVKACLFRKSGPTRVNVQVLGMRLTEQGCAVMGLFWVGPRDVASL